MKRFAMILALTLMTAAFTTVAPATADAAPGMQIPVAGTAARGTTFAGVFELQQFVANADGTIAAVGTLTGTVTRANGTTLGSVVQNVRIPVVIGDATCEILHLDLGPLFLDLLGLQIDLSRIVLDITAQAGAGNLLGNLLCAVTGLLDSPGPLATLLNQILGVLVGSGV
jgi:hypothetical protein